MALSSGHLELSARLGSRHRRRRSPLPRRVRRGRWGARQRGARLGRGRAFCGGVEARWQRSTVKASYSRNGRSASWAAHGTYLAREGARREGGKGRGFSAEQEVSISRRLSVAGSERATSGCGSSSSRPSTPSASTSRRTRERSSPTWSATSGRASSGWPSTDNPHVHLLVRGRDVRGQGLQIHPDYLSQGIRRRSQDLPTQVLGYRAEREMVQARGQSIERLHFTDVDRALIRHEGTRGLVTIDGQLPRSPAAREFRRQELRRLQVLEGLGLVEKVWTRTWRLSPQL